MVSEGNDYSRAVIKYKPYETNGSVGYLKLGRNVFLTGEPGSGKHTVNSYVSFTLVRVEPQLPRQRVCGHAYGGMTPL